MQLQNRCKSSTGQPIWTGSPCATTRGYPNIDWIWARRSQGEPNLRCTAGGDGPPPQFWFSSTLQVHRGRIAQDAATENGERTTVPVFVAAKPLLPAVSAVCAATRYTAVSCDLSGFSWCRVRDLNPRPTVYKTVFPVDREASPGIMSLVFPINDPHTKSPKGALGGHELSPTRFPNASQRGAEGLACD
jgi:hypothetical protein